VAFIIVVVSGILAILIIKPWGEGGPRIGDDWQAGYEIIICGERQANVPESPDWVQQVGIHTHGRGNIHIKPRFGVDEGAGARLVRWFEEGGNFLRTGGKLTKTELQVPGQKDTWKNGDECPDGSEGVLRVFVDGVNKDDWSRYIPQDRDVVRIEFGPEEEAEEAGEPEATEEADEAQPTEEPEATEEAGEAQPTGEPEATEEADEAQPTEEPPEEAN
jgi:hypothetical protein